MATGDNLRICAELVAAGATLARLGLIRGREGNLSVRLSEHEILLTPRGADKGRLRAPDLVRCRVGEPPPPQASSEATVHLAVYSRNTDVHAVVHAHPRAALTLASRALLPDVGSLAEGRALVPRIELLPPLPPGSGELAAACAGALGRAVAAIVRGHGAFTVGKGVGEALERMLVVEQLAAIQLGEAAARAEI